MIYKEGSEATGGGIAFRVGLGAVVHTRAFVNAIWWVDGVGIIPARCRVT